MPSFDADLLPQAVLLIDGHYRIRNANRTWSTLYHHDHAREPGELLLDHIHPKDQHHAKEAIDRAWENGATCNCVVRILDGFNRDRWSDVYLHYHQIEGLACLVASISDISERVGAERLLLAQHRSINSILNDLPGMVYRCRNNPEWPMEYVSEGCAELTGYQADDIIQSRKLSYGSMIIEEDQEAVWLEVQNALREHRRFELTYRIDTAQGDVKWVWEKGKGIYSAESELSGIEGFITDFGRQMLLFQAADGEAASRRVYSHAQFRAHLKQSLERVQAPTDARLMLLCIHLDRYERYMAGAGHRELLQGQACIERTLCGIGQPSDVIFPAAPNRWFVVQRRQAEDVAIQSQAEAIRDAFLAPVEVGSTQLYVSVSIGCALITGRQTIDAGGAVREAIRSMDACHQAGGGPVLVITV